MIPSKINIYHIVNIDRLESILVHDGLYCDATVYGNDDFHGSTIGMSDIKRRRMTELILSCHNNLYVGDCVPFYFCPRSIMLYVIHKGNAELQYKGGQEPIIHLVADFYETIEWAAQQNKRWSFTDSNAGSYTFQSFANVDNLKQLNWGAIETNAWFEVKQSKQAEFLLEEFFPVHLIQEIAVYSLEYQNMANSILKQYNTDIPVSVRRNWYY